VFGVLLGLAFLACAFYLGMKMSGKQSPAKATGRRYASAATRPGLRNGIQRGSDWADAAGRKVQAGARRWGDYEIRKAEERAGRPSRARLAGRRMLAPVVATFADPAEGDGHSRDELAPRREQKNAARQDSSPSPAGPPPSANGRTPGVSSTTTQAGGASADLFTSVQQVMSQARAGGLKAKHRAVKALTEMHDYISQAETSLAQEMSEPDSDYPPQIWEPIAQTAAHSKAASMKMAESDSAMTALENMSVGDLAGSSVHAPHHDELNADA
jgi:hypothetical protein